MLSNIPRDGDALDGITVGQLGDLVVVVAALLPGSGPAGSSRVRRCRHSLLLCRLPVPVDAPPEVYRRVAGVRYALGAGSIAAATTLTVFVAVVS